jgi:hypothetical protein
MELHEIEQRLGMTFPPRHQQAMLDIADPVHEACDFLVPSSPYHLLRLLDVNQMLHTRDNRDCWPSFLIAFASNGCGDYFAYDLRTGPPRIIYMDPDKTVNENLSKKSALEFATFDSWYEWKVERRRNKNSK